MAALVAVSALWILWTAQPDQPVLVEVMRVPVPSGVRRIAVGSLGQWYLTDVEHHRVILRSSEGSMGADVGGYGWGLSALDRPSGVATDGVRVYVADQGNHRIVEYDRELRPLSAFSTRDTSQSNVRFGFPRGVAVSARGDLIVLDGESEEVVCFLSGGRFAFRVGRDVPGGRPLHRPACIAVDDGQRLLIGEAGAVRILDLFGTQIEEMSVASGTEVRGVAGKGAWLAWVTADSLALAERPSGPVHRWSRAALAPDLPPAALLDLAWQGRILLVLTEGAVLGFRIESY